MPLADLPEVIPIPAPTGGFMSPNTDTTTRTDFTDFFLRFRPAEDAHPHYLHYFTVSQDLARLLINHPAMEPNRQQTFATKANSKNKVYFMWDFILRTFQFLAAKVSPQKPYSSGHWWVDVNSRSAMASNLMLDTTGKLERGNAFEGYHDDKGVEFGDEVKALAKKLVELPPACVCGATQKQGGGSLLQCARCKTQQYCSAECQKGHWKVHKLLCGKGPVYGEAGP
jgi:hypothetical protein